MEIEHFLFTIFEEINRRRQCSPLSFTKSLQQRANSEIKKIIFNQQTNSTKSLSMRYKVICEKCFTCEFDPRIENKKKEIFNSFFKGVEINEINLYDYNINSIGFQIALHQSGKVYVYIILAKLYPKEILEPSALSVLIDVNIDEKTTNSDDQQNEKANIENPVNTKPTLIIAERTKSQNVFVNNIENELSDTEKSADSASKHETALQLKIADRKGTMPSSSSIPYDVRNSDSSYLEPLKRIPEEEDYFVQMRDDILPLKIEAIMNALRAHRNLPPFRRDDEAAIILRDLHKRIIFSSQKSERKIFLNLFKEYFNVVNFGYTYNEEYSLKFPAKFVSTFWSNCELRNSHTEENFDKGEVLIVSVVQLRSFCSGIILIGKGDCQKLPTLPELYDYSNHSTIANVRLNALFYDLDSLRHRLGGPHLSKSKKNTELAMDISKSQGLDSSGTPPYAKIIKTNARSNAIVLKMNARNTLKEMKNLVLGFNTKMRNLLLNSGDKVGIGFAPVGDSKEVATAVVIFGTK